MAGGTPTALATSSYATSGFNGVGASAVDSMNFYFIYGTLKLVPSGPSSMTGVVSFWLASVPVGGGDVVIIPTDAAVLNSVVANSTGVYWSTDQAIVKYDANLGTSSTFQAGLSNPTALAIDGTNIFWANRADRVSGGASIWTEPLTGGQPVLLADVQSNPVALAVDDTYVYWANGNSDDGRIMRAPLAGGGASMIAIGNSPSGISVSSPLLYWTNKGDGTVMANHVTGGSSIATEQTNPTSIVATTDAVYWLNGGTGTDGSIMTLRLR